MAVPGLPAPQESYKAQSRWGGPQNPGAVPKITLRPLVSTHTGMTDHRKVEGWGSRGMKGGRPRHITF